MKNRSNLEKRLYKLRESTRRNLETLMETRMRSFEILENLRVRTIDAAFEFVDSGRREAFEIGDVVRSFVSGAWWRSGGKRGGYSLHAFGSGSGSREEGWFRWTFRRRSYRRRWRCFEKIGNFGFSSSLLHRILSSFENSNWSLDFAVKFVGIYMVAKYYFIFENIINHNLRVLKLCYKVVKKIEVVRIIQKKKVLRRKILINII